MAKTPGDKTKDIVLRPGEYRAANGVICGWNADRDVPRFGADETDSGGRGPAEPWASLKALAG